jgi:hypothetical protein
MGTETKKEVLSVERAKDAFLMIILAIVCVILSPFLVILFLVDDIREESFYDKQSKAEYYHRYL